MKHTKCKICGKEHALGGCPEFLSKSGRETDADRPLGRLPPKSASDDKSGRSSSFEGPYIGKFGIAEALFPDSSKETIDKMVDEWTKGVVEKHEKRLAYQAQYQRDLRAATKLGISVKEFRAAKGKEE